MPGSGGSVSDAPIEKTVDGQHHQLAYITPVEAQSLVDQGGKPTMTNEGIMAYPGHHGQSGESMGVSQGSSSNSGSGGDGPPGGGDPGMTYTAPTSQPSGGDQDEDASGLVGHVEYAPVHSIENIHGEFDDPGSASYDPTYDATEQAIATKKSAMGSGKYAGDYKWNPTTQKMDRYPDFTFKEHWENAPDAIKWSPTLRLLYATGKNISEWSKRNSWSWDTNTGTIKDNSGNSVRERDLMNAAAPEAPGLIGETTVPDSQAAKWYANLGNNTSTAFSFSTAYADAKAKQQTILGNPSAIRQLAVNESPFYNWLKENSLNKGIL